MYASIKKNYDILLSDCKTFKTTITKLKLEIHDCRWKKNQVDTRLETAMKRYENLQNERDEMKRSMYEQIQEIRNENLGLKVEVDGYKKQIESLKTSIDVLTSENESMTFFHK